MKRHTYWFLAVLILLVAAWLRLWRLADYPPGPHYDEAANVLIARSIALGGAGYFPIVPGYQGREVLYYYLSAPFFQWVHDGRFSLQLVSSFSSLMTVAATVALGRAMFAGRRGQIIGLVAGALLALSIPQVLLARQAFRAPTLPLMQALALWCLWRGLNGRRGGWLVAAGIFAGGALYTYMASRLFPLWLLIGGLLLILIDRGRRGLRLKQGLLFFGALAFTAAPMALFALQNPDIFLGRLQEVTQPEQSISLTESLVRHVKMFFIEGEILLRYNLPGRPYFTWPEAILLLAGLGGALWRMLRPGASATERTACGLALLSPLMILPSVISVGGFPPNHMRSIAMIPLVFILLGVGAQSLMAAVTTAVEKRGGWAGSPWQQRILIMLAALVLVLGAAGSGAAYFDWARRADLFYDTDADLTLAARWLSPHLTEATRVYVASQHDEHPTLMIANLPDVVWLGQDSLLVPAPDSAGIVIWPHSAPTPPPLWADWLSQYAMPGIPPGPDERPSFAAYRIAGGQALPDGYTPVPQVSSPALRLHGYQASPIFPGASGDVLFAWQVASQTRDANLMAIVQVEDDLGHVLARAENWFPHSQQWRPGESLMYRATVRIPPGTAPGSYALRVTWVVRDSGQYLPFLDAEGQQTGVWASAGQVEVLPPASFPAPESFSIHTQQQTDIAPGVSLLGWGELPAALRPGETLPLTLYWQGTVTDQARTDTSLEALLRDATGQETSLWRGQPTRGRYPAPRWRAGEIVVDPARWPVPRQQPAGHYTLVLRADGTAVEMGALEIAGVPRLFEPPRADTVTQTGLGDALQLYGYSLLTPPEADGLRLTLVWQALAEVDAEYTVFVHVLDDAGNIIAQRDVMPVDNTYPTRLWAAGEYVVDEHAFPALPPGRYALRVGLYQQASGQRLPLADDAQQDFIDLGAVVIP